MMSEVIRKLPPRSDSPNLLFDFDDVLASVRMVEHAIEEQASKVEQQGAESVAKAAADPNRSFIDNPMFTPMASAMWDAEMTFPLILRRSLLIAVSAHVEHVLRRWCNWVHVRWSLTKEIRSFPKERNESTIHHQLRYLRDVGGFDLGDDFAGLSEWPRIDGYRVARNCLAHDGGLVTSAGDRAKIEALPKVEVDESGLLIDGPIVHLLPGACEAAVDSAKAFFDELVRLYHVAERSRSG